jgi:hypothetical protein
MEVTRQLTEPLVLVFTTLLVPVLAVIFGLVLNDSYGWSEDFSVFAFMFPGFLAYSGLLTIYDVASKVGAERETGIQMRLDTTPLTRAEYLLSQMISFSIKPLLQLILALSAALAVGYRPKIFFDVFYTPGFKVAGCFLVLFVMIIFSFSSVGLGMLTAAMTKSANAAAGLSFAFIVPQQIFGTFIPPWILGMAPVGWAMPSYYPTQIFFLIFEGVPLDRWTEPWTLGWPNPTQELWVRFGILFVFSIIVFILGVIVYNRKKRT